MLHCQWMVQSIDDCCTLMATILTITPFVIYMGQLSSCFFSTCLHSTALPSLPFRERLWQSLLVLAKPFNHQSHSKGSLQPDDLPYLIWRVLTLVSETHNIPLWAYQPCSIRNNLSSLTPRLTTPPQTDIPKCDSHWVFQYDHELTTFSRVYSSRSCVCPLFHSRNHALLLRESPALSPKSPGSSPPLTMGTTH
jgi:hypothetical protein